MDFLSYFFLREERERKEFMFCWHYDICLATDQNGELELIMYKVTQHLLRIF